MNLRQSIQLISSIQLLETPAAAAHQVSLSITNSQGLFKLMSINHLIINHCHECIKFALLNSEHSV